MIFQERETPKELKALTQWQCLAIDKTNIVEPYVYANNRWVVCIIEIRGKEGVIWLTQANSRSQEVDLLAPGRLSSISK